MHINTPPDDEELVQVAASGDVDLDSVPEDTLGPIESPTDTGIPGMQQVEIAEESSLVSSSPGKNFVILAILAVASLTFLYFIVFATGEQPAPEEELSEQPIGEQAELTPETEQIDVNIASVDEIDMPEIQDIQPPPPSPVDIADSGQLEEDEVELAFPDIDEIQIEEPEEEEQPQPAQPVQPYVLPTLPPPSVEVQPEVQPDVLDAELAAQKDAKRKANMMLKTGGGSPDENFIEGVGSGDDVEATGAEQATATRMEDLSLLVAQGKIIDTVLETAINTDLPGVLRGIVSRDIYAEAGRNVLIPKGSRLIGNYDSSIERGQKRVYIVWSRLIRPDGIDIEIESPGTDQLGRAGVAGKVDNRYLEIFGNSILLSTLTIAGTYAIEQMTDADEISSATTTDTDGSTSSAETGSPTSLAITDAVTDLGDTAQTVAEGLINAEPTITVNQGTRIKVFVNKDLLFPASVAQDVKFVR